MYSPLNTHVRFSAKKPNTIRVFTLNTSRERNMTRSKPKSNTEKTITLRVTRHQYNRVTQAAEEKNMNNSAFIRSVVDDRLTQQDTNKKIDLLERRLEKRIFEMVASIAGLDEHQRLQAKKQYLSNLKSEAK